MLTQVTNDVIVLIKEVIESHHRELMQASINALFETDRRKKKNGIINASIETVSKKNQQIFEMLGSHFDYILIISFDEYMKMTELQQRALIDHELCHCDFDPVAEKNRAKILDHDFAEFFEIIERYGLWSNDLQEHRQSIQMSLNFLPGENIDAEQIRGTIESILVTSKNNI